MRTLVTISPGTFCLAVALVHEYSAGTSSRPFAASLRTSSCVGVWTRWGQRGVAESMRGFKSISFAAGSTYSRVVSNNVISRKMTGTMPSQTNEQEIVDGKGFEYDEKTVENEIKNLSALECKVRLLELLPRMTGKRNELKQIETLINTMEAKYSPVLTLDFFNLAHGGGWQLLFSTNRLGMPPAGLRLREMVQHVYPGGMQGNITNFVSWDLAEDGTTFDCTGTFSVKCTYKMNHGGRLNIALEQHLLKPIGKKIPTDVQGLVGMLYRAMPKEMFDPSDTSMDTTYLDADVKIVRMTGNAHFEGIRNIFVRKGAVEINPTLG